MREVMSFLADNWVIGVSISITLVVSLHLLFSISLLIKARKIGYDVAVSCMLPTINIYIFIRKCLISRSIDKGYNGNTIKDSDFIEL